MLSQLAPQLVHFILIVVSISSGQSIRLLRFVLSQPLPELIHLVLVVSFLRRHCIWAEISNIPHVYFFIRDCRSMILTAVEPVDL